MQKLIAALGVFTMALLAACGGNAPDPNAAANAQATAEYLASLPEMDVTITGGVEMTIRGDNAAMACTGPNDIVPNAFVISAENLNIYIPINATPGELPVVGRNDPGAVDANNVVVEYLPTSQLFFATGAEGTFTLARLPSQVGELAIGEFDIELDGNGDAPIQLEGAFRVEAGPGITNTCPADVIPAPPPPS